MNKINHRIARKMIQTRLSLVLTPNQDEMLDRHLSACPACQEYARRMQALETRLRQEPHGNGGNGPAPTSETTRIVLGKLRARQVKSGLYTVARLTVVSAGVLLLFLLLSTPQGDALRQSTTQGLLRSFTRILGPNKVQPVWANQTPEIPAATLTPVPTISLAPFAADCGDYRTPRCSVGQIRDKVDFPVKELGIILPGMGISGATGGPDFVYMLYDTPNKSGSIQLFQEPWKGSASQSAWTEAPETAVETVQVGDYPAEYVKGAFHYQDGKPVSWDDQARIQHLRWVEDGVYIVMQIWGEPYGQPIDRDGVVALAESLTAMPAAASLHTVTPVPQNSAFDPRTEVITYTVQEGDTIFYIADTFGLKPETILYGNPAKLFDSPNTLFVGMELNILPVDGVYYEWQEGDDLNEVASRFGVQPEDILNWQGNHLDRDTIGDFSQPDIQPGTMLVIPGGQRALQLRNTPLPTPVR